MRVDRKLCVKFPVVLRDKLLKNEIEFPDTVEFEYNDLYTYRAVARNTGDNRKVTLEDFKSYFELGKMPKKPRGMVGDISKDPCYYGVSSFLKREIVEQKMKFPNPKKRWRQDMFIVQVDLSIQRTSMYVGGFMKGQMLVDLG